MEHDSERMKKTKIVLAGGGSKCAYQVTFLEALLQSPEFQSKYEVEEIIGTSFGAIVGFFVCIGEYELIYRFFSQLNNDSLKPVFDLWGYASWLKAIPMIGNWLGYILDIMWIMVGIHKKGLYTPSNGMKLLDGINLQADNIQDKLNKFTCCVYNVTLGKVEYIKGTHPLIKEYLIASSALWIVFPPQEINRLTVECICDSTCNCSPELLYCNCTNKMHRINEFIDGGVQMPVPIPSALLDEYDTNSINDVEYFVLTTRDVYGLKECANDFVETGDNMFAYLDGVITFLVNQRQAQIVADTKWCERENVRLINYDPESTDPTNLDHETIMHYLADGLLLAYDAIQQLINEQEQ